MAGMVGVSALHELAEWAAREGSLEPYQLEQLAVLGLLDAELLDDPSRVVPDVVQDEVDDHERVEAELARRRPQARGGRRGRRPTSPTRLRLQRVDAKVTAILAEADVELDRLRRLRPGEPFVGWEPLLDDVAATPVDDLVAQLEAVMGRGLLTIADLSGWLGLDPLSLALPSVELEPEDLPTFRRLIGSTDSPLLRTDLPGLGRLLRVERAQLALVHAVRRLVDRWPPAWDQAISTSFDLPMLWLVSALWSLDASRAGLEPTSWLGSADGPEAVMAWRWAAELDDQRTAVLLLEEHLRSTTLPRWLHAVDVLTTRTRSGGEPGAMRRGLVLPPHLAA